MTLPAAHDFDAMWADLSDVGLDASTGGYRRFAWTDVDRTLRDWFAGESARRGLDLTTDRAGNQWAWWGDPDAAATAGRPGLVVGSHLDSVPGGGAFDGPLGVVSAFAAIDGLRADGFAPRRPIGVVNFVDEEGARFGIACAGSRVITGALPGDQARGVRDGDGVTAAEAMVRAGHDADGVGADPQTMRRVGTFVELHVEQGRALVDLGAAVAVGSSIRPHGRWRLDLPGEANHAGTTRLVDRRDPMIALAQTILMARAAATRHGVLATCGKVRVDPNGVNAIAGHVTAWLDARGDDADRVRDLVDDMTALVAGHGGTVTPESFTPRTDFDPGLTARLVATLTAPETGSATAVVPALATGAGHDAGILAQAGVPAAMLFVRNPTGVSHSPAEFAERADCLAGVEALGAVMAELAG